MTEEHPGFRPAPGRDLRQALSHSAGLVLGAWPLRKIMRRVAQTADETARRVRNRRVLARHRAAPPAGAGDVHWLFVATLPRSGSTALSELLAGAPRAVKLWRNGEGQWLVPELCSNGRRWDSKLRVDYPLVRAVWLDQALRGGIAPCLVVEKSPPNLVRLRELVAAFGDMPTSVLRLTRDPYAICASWATRYTPESLAHQWAPELAGRLGTEEAFLRALGTICGQRFEMLAGLDDLATLTVSYERLTERPAETVEAIRRAFPLLDGIDPEARIAVKRYPPQALRNMNAGQIGQLARAQIDALTEGLAPHRKAVEAFGYSLA